MQDTALDTPNFDFQIDVLLTRKMPSQMRAVERIRVILSATARLLCKLQPDQLNTTAIAEEAQVPVSSIYRYFPTLEDVLRELYHQASHQIREQLFVALSDTKALPTWRARLKAALATLRDHIARHPYYRPLLVLSVSNRGPVASEDGEHDELVLFLANRWSDGLDGFSGGDPQIVACAVVQTAISMEDLIAAQSQNDVADSYFQEMTLVLESYLSHYLNDG